MIFPYLKMVKRENGCPEEQYALIIWALSKVRITIG